jgi:hypothetical protein
MAVERGRGDFARRVGGGACLACFGEVAEGGVIHLLEKILVSKD